MRKSSGELNKREIVFATKYRGLQHAISSLTGDPQPPCYFCADQQIWSCSRSGRECCAFTKYYSSYDL